MASAFKDKHGWVADFRAPHAPGKRRRRVRIPPERSATERDARQYADECERYCRLLESDHFDQADLRHAVELGAITPDQAFDLSGNPAYATRQASTPRKAFEMHPSTVRERRRNPADYDRHLNALNDFTARFHITHVREITLDLVQKWIDEMKRDGLRFDSRRHRLLPIRRACRMAPNLGYPDTLSGLVLDRDDDPAPVKVYSLADLLKTALLLAKDPDPRYLAALALGAFMGLRPSEICRVRCCDIEDGVLRVGHRVRKNASSQRSLPIPQTILPWIVRAGTGRTGDAPLILPDNWRGRRGYEFDQGTFAQFIKGRLHGTIKPYLPPKAWRKSFMSWAVRAGINPAMMETWVGHRRSDVLPISARHYMEEIMIAQLRDVADQMDAIIQAQKDYPKLKKLVSTKRPRRSKNGKQPAK